MNTHQDGAEFVRKMSELGADYIKIIIEEQSGAGRHVGAEYPIEIGRAIAGEAHRLGKKVISHATDIQSFRKAAETGADVITHMPMTGEMPDDIVQSVVNNHEVLTPTITMMDAIAANIRKVKPDAPVSTDANEDEPCPPAGVEYGKGLLDEIMNMQECGVIEPGKVADILMVDWNPQEDLRDIYNTWDVWFEGVRKV